MTVLVVVVNVGKMTALGVVVDPKHIVKSSITAHSLYARPNL